MTVLARSASMVDELPIGPVTELADVNPACPLTGLEPDSVVSFIPMSDASESGQWIGRQTRKLREVRSGYTPFREGDVLFAKITPCMENGKGCHAQGLINGVGFGSTEFHVLRAKPNADARFLYHWLQSDMLRLAAEAMMTGSAGQRRVPSEFFGRLPIPLLPLYEQRRIAEILDTADQVIGETEGLISKLKHMKTGLMHDLLTRGLDEGGQLRDPETHPEQFKESSLGRIPREWEVHDLGSLCQKITDGSHQSVKTTSKGVPFLYVSCIRDGRILWDQAAKITKQTFEEISRGREPKPGVILYTAVGSYGHAALVREHYPFSFQRHIAYVLPDTTRVSSAFLVNWLNSEWCRTYADKVALGNAQKTVTLGELTHFPVPVPPPSEQQRITEILSAHDTRIRAEEAYRDKLKLQEKGLVDDLLTGRVRVKEAQEVGS